MKGIGVPPDKFVLGSSKSNMELTIGPESFKGSGNDSKPENLKDLYERLILLFHIPMIRRYDEDWFNWIRIFSA